MFIDFDSIRIVRFDAAFLIRAIWIVLWVYARRIGFDHIPPKYKSIYMPVSCTKAAFSLVRRLKQVQSAYVKLFYHTNIDIDSEQVEALNGKLLALVQARNKRINIRFQFWIHTPLIA